MRLVRLFRTQISVRYSSESSPQERHFTEATKPNRTYKQKHEPTALLIAGYRCFRAVKKQQTHATTRSILTGIYVCADWKADADNKMRSTIQPRKHIHTIVVYFTVGLSELDGYLRCRPDTLAVWCLCLDRLGNCPIRCWHAGSTCILLHMLTFCHVIWIANSRWHVHVNQLAWMDRFYSTMGKLAPAQLRSLAEPTWVA